MTPLVLPAQECLPRDASSSTPPASKTVSQAGSIEEALQEIGESVNSKAELTTCIGQVLLNRGACVFTYWTALPHSQLRVDCAIESSGASLEESLLMRLAQFVQKTLSTGEESSHQLTSRFRYRVFVTPVVQRGQSEAIAACYPLDQHDTKATDGQHASVQLSDTIETRRHDVACAAQQVALWHSKQPSAEEMAPPRPAVTIESGLLHLITRALEGTDQISPLAALSSGLRTLLDCDNIALAIVDSDTNEIRFFATSNEAEQYRHSRQTVLTEELLRQAVALDGPLTYPRFPGWDGPTSRQLSELVALIGSEAALCMPLKTTQGLTIGAWLVTGTETFISSKAKQKLLVQMSLPLAACLHAHAAAHKRWFSGVKQRVRRSVRSRKGLVTLSASLFLLLLGALPWQYRVRCGCRCEPVTRRFVAAPFSGLLLKSHVSPGDHVEQNALLATMDGSELRSQVAAVQARLRQAEQRYDAALATQKAAEVLKERMEVRQLQAQLEILQERERRLELRSPIEGFVISGDLMEAEGVPLEMGQRLFEIAPMSELVAEIAVPEEQIAHVECGMRTTVLFDAHPNTKFEGTIERIHPRSEIRDGKSVFIAEMKINSSPIQLLPGMSGTARIETGRRLFAWVLWHRPWYAIRRTVGW